MKEKSNDERNQKLGERKPTKLLPKDLQSRMESA
jgi:hypothetical protein